MQVLLLADVEKLGLRGDVIDVARGYARNYLLPRRLAETATPARVAEHQKRESRRALQEARTAEQAQEIAEVLSKTVLRFEVKAGPTGALFGSVTATDVADELWRVRKIRIDRRKIDLDQADRPLRAADRRLCRRPGRREDARRTGGRRAAARGRGGAGRGRRRGRDGGR